MPEPSDPLRRAHDAHGRRDWAVARGRSSSLLGNLVSHCRRTTWTRSATAPGGSVLATSPMAAYEARTGSSPGQDQPRKAAMSAGGAAVTLFLRGDATLGSGWMAARSGCWPTSPSVPSTATCSTRRSRARLDQADLDAVIDGARRLQDLGRRQATRHWSRSASSRKVAPWSGRAGARGNGAAGRGDARGAVRRAGPGVHRATSTATWSPPAGSWATSDGRASGPPHSKRWLARLPAAVVFAGICRVHRAQLLQAAG